jgi:hypothetical protein
VIFDRILGKPVNELCIRKKRARRIEERRQDPESPQSPMVEKDIALCAAIEIFDLIPEIIGRSFSYCGRKL